MHQSTMKADQNSSINFDSKDNVRHPYSMFQPPETYHTVIAGDRAQKGLEYTVSTSFYFWQVILIIIDYSIINHFFLSIDIH